MYIHDNIRIRDENKNDMNYTSGLARCTYFNSLTEFVNITFKALRFKQESDVSYKRGIRDEVNPLIKNGWAAVLEKLHEVEEVARGAFAPVTYNKWDWSGSRLELDRFLIARPCFARPVKRQKYMSQFIRILFIGEACWGSSFVKKMAELLSYIQKCESNKQKVELFVGFGAQNNIWVNRRNYGLLNIAKVKDFNHPTNLLELSCLGHSSLFRFLQFGWEVAQKYFITEDQAKDPLWKKGGTKVGSCSYYNKEYYKRALVEFVGEKEAEDTIFIGSPHDIDPMKWAEKYN